MIRSALAVWLLLAASALGQVVPKAIVVGPKESISGDMVKLDGSQSTGSGYCWKLAYAMTDSGRVPPAELSAKAFYPQDNNTAILFSAGVRKETTFTFLLAVSGVNTNGGTVTDITFFDLKITPLYPPGPDVPTVKPEVPTTDPTIGPVTTEKVTRLLILHENDSDTYQFQKLVQYLRANKDVGRLLLVFDKDAKTPDETISKIVQAAVQYVNGATLPRIIAVGTSGGFVKQAEMPKTEEELEKLLKDWGLVK